MFFIKKKKIKLEIYTWVGQLIELFPPIIANESKPSWWHNLPITRGPNRQSNVRHCYGLKDLFSQGFIVPSWGDFDVVVPPTGPVYVNSPVRQSEGHSSTHNVEDGQTGWEGYVNTKLHTPWAMYCDEPVKWALIQPTWHQPNPQEWTMVPGVTEFRYQHQAHANIIHKRQNHEYVTKIKAGDPLIHIFPITERPFEIELKVMDQHEWGERFARWEFTGDFLYHKTRAILEKKQ